VSVRTVHALASSADEVAREIRGALAPVEPVVVIYFAGGSRDPAALAEAVQNALPGALVVGCTASGELEGKTWRKGSVVAMGLGAEIVHVAAAAALERISDKPDPVLVLVQLVGQLGVPLAHQDPTRYVGVLLVDGLSRAEEWLMDRLGDLTDIPIVGGSASDELKFAATWVSKDGRALQNAAVLLLLEPAVPFRVLKTQSFRSLGRALRVTKADEDSRVVHAFDGAPAASRYAEVLGVGKEDLHLHFMKNPLGLMAGEDPFVRSPQQVRGEDVVFYASVREGAVLTLLESTDIVLDTRRALAETCAELGGASAHLDFDCVLRSLEIDATGRAEAYGALFEVAPTIGFATYGEQFIGHVNQTATMLIFGLKHPA